MHADKISSEVFNDMVLGKVNNAEVFNESKKHYWVGFPSEGIINEIVKSKTHQSSNTPFYNHDTEGSVGFLDQEWVKQKCEKNVFYSLNKSQTEHILLQIVLGIVYLKICKGFGPSIVLMPTNILAKQH